MRNPMTLDSIEFDAFADELEKIANEVPQGSWEPPAKKPNKLLRGAAAVAGTAALGYGAIKGGKHLIRKGVETAMTEVGKHAPAVGKNIGKNIVLSAKEEVAAPLRSVGERIRGGLSKTKKVLNTDVRDFFPGKGKP